MPKTTKPKQFFRMEEKGSTADKKGSIYNGFIGNYDLGAVVAPNKTTARKRLLAIARKMCK